MPLFKGLPLLVLLISLSIQSAYGATTGLLADGNSTVFNPFIDYSELKDRVSEEESINFFEHGRSLTVIAYGGYEAITFNISNIYGDSPTVFGAALSFFFDLNFAMQVGISFPRGHYNSLLQSQTTFSNYNLDFKYYFKRQYLVKSVAKLSPYIIFGPFWLNLYGYRNLPPHQGAGAPTATADKPAVSLAPPAGATPTAPSTDPNQPPTELEDTQVFDFSAVGAKIGLGVEIPLIKQTYIGLEVAYLFSNLYLENTDLSLFESLTNSTNATYKNFIARRIYPDIPYVKNWRAYGDMAVAVFLLGVNF